MAHHKGKHKMGKGCLSVKRLADVDQKVLVELIGQSIDENKRLVQSKMKPTKT